MYKIVNYSGKHTIINNALLFTGILALTLLVVLTNGVIATTYRAMIASLGILCIVALHSYTIVSMVNSRMFLVLLFFLLYVTLFSYLEHGISTTIGALLSQLVYFIGIPLTYAIIAREYSTKYLGLLFAGIICIWLYENIQVINLCLSNPNIGRLISAHIADFSLVNSIGSPYGIAEGTCAFSIAIFRFASDKEYPIKPLYRLVLIMVVAVFAFAVYQTQSTITSLVLLVFLVIVLILNVSRGGYSKRVRTVSLVAIVVILILTAFHRFLGDMLIEQFSGSRNVFNIRMVEIGRAFAGYDVSNDIQTRLELLKQSWSTIWRHPLFGNLYFGGGVSGEHCHLLDVLSDYGLFGGIPYLLIYVFFVSRLKTVLKNYDRFIWLPVAMMSLLNPMRIYQTYFAVFFLVPFSYILFGRIKESSKTGSELR